jgi:dTDP-4-amino-4,6-dideoxygalactose transaminase
MCTHREPSYEGSAAPGALPHSEQAQEHCIILPLYPQMTRDDQQQVADALQRACAR